MDETDIINNIICTIDNNTKKPEQFLSVQNEIAQNLKSTIKHLYDFTKEQSQRNTNALPELVTEGFDEEQIWQQLELQNEGELDHLISNVSKVLAKSKKITIPLTVTKPEIKHSSENEMRKEKVDIEEEDDDIGEEDEESLEDEIELKNNFKKQKEKKGKKKPSIVDDKFFKLQELDEYLTKEERKEKQNDTDDSDNETVDLFNDFSDEEDKTEEKKLLKYTDFFDSPQSEDDDKSFHDSNNEMAMDNEEEGSKTNKKKVTFSLTNDSDETDSLENKTIAIKVDNEIKSTLETRQERVKKKIEQLEHVALSEKPWQLKGEVSATNRPQNSLLEEFVEFDVTTRPPPVITEKTTLKLEDIIIQRIKDKAWDDVEKKFKPVDTPLEYKKKLILNQEKSKESLSQIYENEYLKQKEALKPDSNEKEEEEPKLHIEIREMMHSLFAKLDALSNFHYTPKLAKPEIKIISNIPAINMEDVAPVGMSDAVLLAPEEIKAKPRGDLIGKAERTKTDMKRERRRKKVHQRVRQQAVEKKEKLNALKPKIAKKKKEDAALVKKLTKNRNIIKMDETNSTVPKSSTAFFTQLQDQMKSQIKAKTNTGTKNKQKDSLSAVKLKL